MTEPDFKQSQATIINGVTLTKHSICYMKELQEANNELIKEIRQELHGATSLMLDALDFVDNDTSSEMLESIKYLNHLSKSLKNLMKP